MIPRIKRIKDNSELGKYLVVGYMDGGNYGSDACSTMLDAFRFWLYHCGVSPKICFGFHIGKEIKLGGIGMGKYDFTNETPFNEQPLYKQGYEDAIDNAYEWLKTRNVLTDASLEGFKKAMEE